MSAHFNSPDGQQPQGVFLLDPATGLPTSPTNVTLSGPITVSNEVEIKNAEGNPIPFSAATLPLPTGAASATLQTSGNASLTSLDAKVPTPSTPGLLPVDTLAPLGVARLLAMGATSANLALTPTARRVSIHATVAGFFSVGTGAQTASVTSHYIGAAERLDFDVAANAQIAAIRSVDSGTLYISELGVA